MCRGSRRHWVALALLAVATSLLGAVAVAVAAVGRTQRPTPSAQKADAQQCSQGRYLASRDPANPLALPTTPGADPLNAERISSSTDPATGPPQARSRACWESIPTSYPDNYSWARFRRELDFGRFHARLSADPRLAYRVHLLEKIADQPEAQRFSAYSMGGGPGAIFAQVQKIFCHNVTADPGSIPIISTYFAHPAVGSCASAGDIAAATPTFRRRIDEMAAGTGRRPAVYLLEIDGFGSSSCMARMGTLGAYEDLIRYEVNTIGSLPHTVVYMEAGYSDANSAVVHGTGAERRRGLADPRLLHQRHPRELDDLRGPLGREGLTPDPRREFHRQHRAERQRPQAQPASGDSGQRGSL